ncbi:MAG: hypothetical protein QXJ17_06205 [Nitrososphaeria archaeon]
MYRERLENAKGFGEIFSLVKSSLAEKLGLHRAGLSLVLMDLPRNILAQHQIGSNSIVMNRKVLEAIKAESSTKLEQNSYIFVVLLHEYLHSFGISDENRVRELVCDIVEYTFGKDHPTYTAATNPLSLLDNKQLLFKDVDAPSKPSIIKDFDKESMPFIG